MEKEDRFKADKDFEEAMCMVAGTQFLRCSEKAANLVFVKESMLKAVRVLKRSVNKNKTMDIELKYSLKMRLNSIEKKIRVLSEERNDDWNIISNLLIIISLLYGYENGKIVRNVIYTK